MESEASHPDKTFWEAFKSKIAKLVEKFSEFKRIRPDGKLGMLDTFNSLSGEQKTNLAWLIDLASAGVRLETLPSITVSRRTVSLRYTSSTDPATMTSYT